MSQSSENADAGQFKIFKIYYFIYVFKTLFLVWLRPVLMF